MGIEPTSGMSPCRSPVLKTGAGTSRTCAPVARWDAAYRDFERGAMYHTWDELPRRNPPEVIVIRNLRNRGDC